MLTLNNLGTFTLRTPKANYQQTETTQKKGMAEATNFAVINKIANTCDISHVLVIPEIYELVIINLHHKCLLAGHQVLYF